MKATLTLLALTLLFSATARTDDDRRLEKMMVADVVKSLSLADARFEHIDEPPGKLQALECEATLRDSKAKVRIRIDVVYTLALFSDTRRWDPKAINAAEVRHVTITPIGNGRR